MSKASHSCRNRLTEGETSELDEHHFNRDVTTAGDVRSALAAPPGKAVNRRSDCRVAEIVELEVALTEGADDAVFGGGAGINRQVIREREVK